MAENESGSVLCQKCGNIARFNVVVTHPRVDGKWCRTACSRNCADLLIRDGCREILATVNGAGQCAWSIAPVLTGKNPGVVVR